MLPRADLGVKVRMYRIQGSWGVQHLGQSEGEVGPACSAQLSVRPSGGAAVGEGQKQSLAPPGGAQLPRQPQLVMVVAPAGRAII